MPPRRYTLYERLAWRWFRLTYCGDGLKWLAAVLATVGGFAFWTAAVFR